MDQICDIAYRNALVLIKFSEDLAFPIAEREGRKGYITYMAGMDTIMTQRVELKESKRGKEEVRRIQNKQDIEVSNQYGSINY